MITLFNIIRGKYDSNLVLVIHVNDLSITRGNKYIGLLIRDIFDYDIRKFWLTFRIINIRNSLRDRVTFAAAQWAKVLCRSVPRSVCVCPPSRDCTETPQNSGELGVGLLFSAENLQNLWNGARWHKGHYWWPIGSCKRAFDWYQNQRLGWRWTAIMRSASNTCVFGVHHENFNEDRPTLSAAVM